MRISVLWNYGATSYANICVILLSNSLRVCQGSYDAVLIKAWEDWDEKHGSENDHPKEFPEKQVSLCIDHE